MNAEQVPPDQAARERILHDLDTTLFVEAGAGSGKTTALVGRVVHLVRSGAVELAHLAAITFTEKAGAELRDRVRRELQQHATDPATPTEEAARCRTALGQLDGAAIGTLHSFAQRILSEHPVEAQLPPRVEVLDEVTSGIAFERRWIRVLDQLLDDRELEQTILLLTVAGVSPAKLRSLALAFDGSWDLVEERVPRSASPPPSIEHQLPAIVTEMDKLRVLTAECVDPTDKLLDRIGMIAGHIQVMEDAAGDDVDLMEALVAATGKITSGGKGRAVAWRNDCKADVVSQIDQLNLVIERTRSAALQAAVHHLGSAMARHTLAAAAGRRAAGRLEFHDLLVLARKVLSDPERGATVRRSLQERYQRLLLDEFQDTDPIQIELAVRIAAAEPATADADRWADVPVASGRLFVVGDPKQSIYRFRRADIATFLEARDRFAADAGGTVELTANFRTVEPVIDWVNTTFGTLMQEPALPILSQPEYVSLDAQRDAAPSGPPVSLLGRAAHPIGTRADPLRIAEATDVAHAVTVVLDERWQVRDDTAHSGWRDACLGDITILVPARTSLPFLEEALETARIPFRAESSSLVYASREVRDLLMVLRAADDPTDHLRIVSALRTPLLGCGDDDLFRHKVLEHRSWNYTGTTAPDPADGVVSEGLTLLRSLHDSRHWSSPAELLDRIARDGRALELAFGEGRPRDVWRRIRFVIDQARQWSEAAGGSLRAYLRWVDQQTIEGARVTESVLPETDDDAVRIMTIHAAKGLEFPITIVSGLTTGASGRRNAVDVVFPRDHSTVGYRLGKDVVTDEFEAWKPIDEQMGFDERIRLLYVACTRACDHLVVATHRALQKNERRPDLRTNAELLVDGMGAALLESLPDLGGVAVPRHVDPAAVPIPPPPFDAWLAERDRTIAVAAVPGAVAATALTDEGTPDPGLDPASAAPPRGEAPTMLDSPSLFDLLDGDPGPSEPTDLDSVDQLDEPDPGLQKRPRDLDLPPWLKGRYGTSVGRAVHGVLQTIDLTTGAGLDGAVAAQCQAEAVPERAGEVTELVQAALASPVVREAAAADHWREIYACVPIGDRLLEGYVDLLYRGPHGLVVVDHKTSASAEAEELDRRVHGYRLQGAAYARAVSAATGEPVVRVVFLFLTPAGAIERDLIDLPEAVAEVERLVADGAELVTS